MTIDTVSLAAAWRARAAAGYAGPVAVRITARGFAVVVQHGDVSYTAGIHHARYKASAQAEQIARHVGANGDLPRRRQFVG